MTKNPCRTCESSTFDTYTKHYVPSITCQCLQCEKWRKHKEYLKSKRKFTRGDPIATLDELLKQEWVIWHGYTKHIEMFRSMSIRTVEHFLRNGAFYKAIRKEQ